MSQPEQFQCVVVGPEGKVMDCRTASAVFPAHDGQVGIWPNHMPLFCNLGMGLVSVTPAEPDGQESPKVLVDGGFALICNNMVKIVSYDAISTQDARPERIEQRVAAIKKRLASGSLDQPLRQHDLKKISLLQELLRAGFHHSKEVL